MAYIPPSGVIQLMKGVNLDNRYMHTIYFANDALQNTWFTTKVTNIFTNQYYTRHNENTIRIKIKSDSIADCTYMRFQNEPNGKWYYAFITYVNYINENVTEVIYEIDVVQTWFIQGGTLLPCFIERQHVSDDTFGLNLEAEPVGSDCYDLSEISVDGVAEDFSSYQVVINTSKEPDSSNMKRDGIVVGTYFDYTGTTEAGLEILKNKMIESLGSWDKNIQSASIVDMFMFPTAFTFGATGEYHSSTYHVKHNGKFSNYKPKNNKLHSYPYSALYVTTNDADNGMYRWEFFEGDITNDPTGAQFDLNATLTGGGSIEIHPHSYNGIENNYDAKVVMNNFPKCSWAYDAYQAWIANGGQFKARYDYSMTQQKGTLAIAKAGLEAVSNVAGIGVSAQRNAKTKHPNNPAQYAGSALMTGVNGLIGIEETSLNYTEARDKIAFEFKDARYEPNIVVGAQVPNISVGYGFLKYRFFNLHIRDDEAKRIDDFFSVYGYAINKVDTPNLNNRKHWNFIKTKNAQISGNMPASSKAALAKIFDGGIFFWRNGDECGNFNVEIKNGSINNPIV